MSMESKVYNYLDLDDADISKMKKAVSNRGKIESKGVLIATVVLPMISILFLFAGLWLLSNLVDFEEQNLGNPILIFILIPMISAIPLIIFFVYASKIKEEKMLINIYDAAASNIKNGELEGSDGRLSIGLKVRHFKNETAEDKDMYTYRISGVVRSSVDGSEVVLYNALYGKGETWVRPISEFVALVDKDKYPDIKQEYVFEVVE